MEPCIRLRFRLGWSGCRGLGFHRRSYDCIDDSEQYFLNDVLLTLIPLRMVSAEILRPVESRNDSRSELINDLRVMRSSASNSCGKRLGKFLLASRVV